MLKFLKLKHGGNYSRRMPATGVFNKIKTRFGKFFTFTAFKQNLAIAQGAFSMRPKLAAGILFLFCIIETMPLLPFAEYYLNYEYISEVLCINKDRPMSQCNGQCHLKDQLKKAQQREQEKKALPKTEWEKIPMISIENRLSASDGRFIVLQTNLMAYVFSLKEISLSPPTPPPQC